MRRQMLKHICCCLETSLLLVPDVINKLIDSYHAGKHGIIVPVYDGQRGHPVIFDSKYKKELLAIDGQGAKEVTEKHARDIFEVTRGLT